MPAHIDLAVCRHLLPEVSIACRQRGLSGVTPLSFEPRCDRPLPGWPDLLAALQPAPGPCADVVAVGAGCLPAGPAPCGAGRVRIVRSSTCFALLTNETQVNTWVSGGCYLVTPGWLRHWRDAVSAWGYDRATARSHFGEFARTVLLLDTGTAPHAAAHLHDFAQFLALGEDVHRVGLDVLGNRISRAVQCPP
jgi:hypothetical protein